MSIRPFQLLLVCLVTSTVWAANDPFVGKWKVNSSKSKLYDEVRIEVAGANRYALTFGPGQTDTVVADGTDQPALSGTTLSVTVKGPHHWDVTRKMNGRTLLTVVLPHVILLPDASRAMLPSPLGSQCSC